jgi:conjugal transfer pilus assembly protein TraK
VLLLSLNIGLASAAQYVIGKPDETLSASISRTDQTLIRIAGHKIRRLFGVEGTFTSTPDKEAGAIYIKPTTNVSVLTVHVSDENGRTWKLLLSVVNAPVDTIVIKEKNSLSVSLNQHGKNLPREDAIKEMLNALMSNKKDDANEYEDTHDVTQLWKEAEFVRVKNIKGSTLIGDKYQLTNTSNKVMIIDERELYRKGVVEVTVDKPNLQPGESSEVFVISANTADDSDE